MPSNKRAQSAAMQALADLDDRARATMGSEDAADFGGGWSEMLAPKATKRPRRHSPVSALKADLAKKAAREKAAQDAAIQELLQKTEAGFGVPGDAPGAMPFKLYPEDAQKQWLQANPGRPPVGVNINALSTEARKRLFGGTET